MIEAELSYFEADSATVDADEDRAGTSPATSKAGSFPALLRSSRAEESYLATESTSAAAIGLALEDPQASSIDENKMNELRLAGFHQLSDSLLRLIGDTDFEYGFESEAERFIRKCLSINAVQTRDWLNQIFIDRFDEPWAALGILQAIAHLELFEIKPQGPTMALAALKHEDAEVRECGIRAFEQWGGPESLKMLHSISKPEEDWLSDYYIQVVRDLEDDLMNEPVVEKDQQS